ncbi:MAG: AMP-binding protein [Gemmatimonadota bacterium]
MSSPWLSHYDAGVPHTLFPYPEKTLLDVVRETVRERPGHSAFLFKGARLSYGEFDRQSDAFAASLIASGVKKGDRVAIMLPNCPQALIAQFGVWKAGGIASPVNPLYTEHELEHALKENGAEVAVVLTPFYGKLKALQSRSKLRHIIATSIKEYLPPLLRIAFTLLKEKKEGHRITLLERDTWFQDELSRHARTPVTVDVSPSDHALLLFSGGTTGLPKAVLIRHHALVIAATQLRAWFSGVLTDWVNPILATFPMFHVAGDVAILSVGLLTRNPIALVPNPRDLEDLIKTIKREKIAFLPAVPTLLNSIIARAADAKGGVDLRSIRLTLAGSAPLLAETKRRFEALTGGRVINVYSMTEAVMATLSSPALGTFKDGSIGLPLPDVELRIVDAETGQHEVAQGEVGELALRAPQLMEGYYNRPEATAEMLRDGWLYTGDLGFMDADGYVTLVDRKKDVIKPSGFQVWPTEVEETIATHPSVAEVCVAGVPDPHQSEAVKAWVVLRPGTTLTAEELRTHCRATLAAYKIPRHVEFRTSLPKSAVGKILRRELVKEEAAATAPREVS